MKGRQEEVKESQEILNKNQIVDKTARSSEELIQEVTRSGTKVAYLYVPAICSAVRNEHPGWSNQQIRDNIFARCKKIWKKKYIYFSLPSWVHDQARVKAATKAWETKNRRKLDEASLLFADWLERAEQISDPLSEEDQPIEEVEEEPTPYELYQEIVRNIEKLWLSETNHHRMASKMDDIMLEFIKPSRERYLTIFKAIPEVEQAQLHNWQYWLKQLLEDRVNLSSKIQKEREEKGLNYDK